MLVHGKQKLCELNNKTLKVAPSKISRIPSLNGIKTYVWGLYVVASCRYCVFLSIFGFYSSYLPIHYLDEAIDKLALYDSEDNSGLVKTAVLNKFLFKKTVHQF